MRMDLEDKIKAAAEILLPKYIKDSRELPYKLDCIKLLGGSTSIYYWNTYLEANIRVWHEEIWDDPLDCIKVMRHRLLENLAECYEISKEEFDAATLPYNKNAGLMEK